MVQEWVSEIETTLNKLQHLVETAVASEDVAHSLRTVRQSDIQLGETLRAQLVSMLDKLIAGFAPGGWIAALETKTAQESVEST